MGTDVSLHRFQCKRLPLLKFHNFMSFFIDALFSLFFPRNVLNNAKSRLSKVLLLPLLFFFFKIRKKHKQNLPPNTRKILTLHHNKTPHFCVVSKVHEEGDRFSSFTCSRISNLQMGEFLLPLVKNSLHFRNSKIGTT